VYGVKVEYISFVCTVCNRIITSPHNYSLQPIYLEMDSKKTCAEIEFTKVNLQKV
jgi:hypothetical protein